MKPSLLIEAQALIAKLPKGGKKDLADRLGWYPARVAKLAKGEEPRCAGGWKAREQMTQMAVMELRKMTSSANYSRCAMSERNDEMTKRALRGEKLTEISKEFGVSAARVRQIVARVCRRQNPQWFAAMPTYKENDEYNAWGFDLQWVRDHKRVFFEDV